MPENYDFSGWATRANIKCSDGRIISKDAFRHMDGQTVPLVWNHQHTSPEDILGHALLEARDDGIYTYGKFNNSPLAQTAKDALINGDLDSLSIYANKLKQNGPVVMHGSIREVSLVIAGANPGAYIDSVVAHSDDTDEEAIIYTNELINLKHSDEKKEEEPVAEETKKETGSEKEKTIKEVFDEFTDEQKDVVYALIGMAVEAAQEEDNEEEEEDPDMKHNVFENDEDTGDVLTHSEMENILKDAKRQGSLRDSFIAHGIDNIEFLFPDYKDVNGGAPTFINNQPVEWVDGFMKGVHKSPFSRIRTTFADIRGDEARAKGYMTKGKFKKEEVFSLSKRTADPVTVYKKQKIDRDDVNDITDFDVITWLKAEMRTKLDEEIARACIFSDGRTSIDEDKISESNIIPVVKDNDLFTIKTTVTAGEDGDLTKAIVRAAVKSQDNYEGSGSLTFYASNGTISDMLLLEDKNGNRLYKTISDLALALNVSKIVKVPASYIPEGVYAVMFDLRDYTIGADKGGSVNMFDDFDIDYNQMKYLIETRCSGMLTKALSAIVLKANS